MSNLTAGQIEQMRGILRGFQCKNSNEILNSNDIVEYLESICEVALSFKNATRLDHGKNEDTKLIEDIGMKLRKLSETSFATKSSSRIKNSIERINA